MAPPSTTTQNNNIRQLTKGRRRWRQRERRLKILSTRVFETRTATGSELFSPLPATFTLLIIVSLLEMISVKIWETPVSWHAKCSLPVAVRVSKTLVLKLPIISRYGNNFVITQSRSEWKVCINIIGMKLAWIFWGENLKCPLMFSRPLHNPK